jgi:predicted enzyme related to lactoylglutathione lyase
MITSENIPNLPGWLDLGSPDAGASAAFYGRVFGWTAEELIPDSDAGPGYWFLRKDGKLLGGLGGLPDQTAKPDWMIYVRVADAAASMAAAEAKGAKVRVPVTAVPGNGAFVQLTDPSGAEFALWQAGEITGFQTCCVDDTMLWAELWTRDPAAAKSFYPALFGWKVEPYMEGAPEGGGYDMWTTQAGDPQAAFGGIMTITDQVPIQDEKWIPYFMVADADATVERVTGSGGTVLIPAADAPPGRLAALADQFGARFNILQPSPMG